jgi:hypothetical protein
VHFTDKSGSIQFQNDHEPAPPASLWPIGEVRQGPFTVSIPERLTGVFDIRIGLFNPATGQRARLAGVDDGERRCLVGRLRISPDRIEFEPEARVPVKSAGDPALFTRADSGWADGLHPVDRFVKNTYEILSPLYELTARMPLTRHQFLTTDHKIQRTLFGEGIGAVEVIVNTSTGDYRHESRSGGTVRLPPYGFLIESPTFVAFHARSWNGRQYEAPVFFTLRSLDGKPLEYSRKVRVYHGFGDGHVQVSGAVRSIRGEATIDRSAPGAG